MGHWCIILFVYTNQPNSLEIFLHKLTIFPHYSWHLIVKWLSFSKFWNLNIIPCLSLDHGELQNSQRLQNQLQMQQQGLMKEIILYHGILHQYLVILHLNFSREGINSLQNPNFRRNSNKWVMSYGVTCQVGWMDFRDNI